MHEHISLEFYRKRMIRLCVPTQPRSWPRRSKDRWALLHSVARQVAPDEKLDEPTMNGRIQGWLASLGEGFEFDVSALRRMLVDEGFINRERNGSTYWKSRRHEDRVTFEDGVASLDDEELIDAERAVLQRRREEHQ